MTAGSALLIISSNNPPRVRCTLSNCDLKKRLNYTRNPYTEYHFSVIDFNRFVELNIFNNFYILIIFYSSITQCIFLKEAKKI